jgi:hypothetical protein
MSYKLQAWLCAVGLLVSVQTLDAGDATVAPGWDLFATDPTGTSFPGLGNLHGVPLGTFDFDNFFGRGIGVQNVGNTDTIIERLLAATSVSGPIPITLVALQLETVAPVNFAGNGLDNYFITLQSAR